MELEFSRQIFEKQSNIKFHKNLPRESIKFHENLPLRAKLFHAAMTKLTVVIRNFENAPENDIQ